MEEAGVRRREQGRSTSQMRTQPSNLCLFLWWIEALYFGKYFDETVREAIGKAAAGTVRKGCGGTSPEQAGWPAGSRSSSPDWPVVRKRKRPPEATVGDVWDERAPSETLVEIRLGDFEIMQGHMRALVTEEFHDGSKADAGPQQFSGIGVAKLVRDNASGNSSYGHDVL
jgi:hypothetical protein